MIVLMALCVGLVLSDRDDRDTRHESLADGDGNERVTLVESDVESDAADVPVRDAVGIGVVDALALPLTVELSDCDELTL